MERFIPLECFRKRGNIFDVLEGGLAFARKIRLDLRSAGAR